MKNTFSITNVFFKCHWDWLFEIFSLGNFINWKNNINGALAITFNINSWRDNSIKTLHARPRSLLFYKKRIFNWPISRSGDFIFPVHFSMDKDFLSWWHHSNPFNVVPLWQSELKIAAKYWMALFSLYLIIV